MPVSPSSARRFLPLTAASCRPHTVCSVLCPPPCVVESLELFGTQGGFGVVLFAFVVVAGTFGLVLLRLSLSRALLIYWLARAEPDVAADGEGRLSAVGATDRGRQELAGRACLGRRGAQASGSVSA